MTFLLRLLQLVAGNAIQGISVATLVRANLGLPGWDVFHQGLAGTFSLALGTMVVMVSLLVLLLWIPLRERPGIGTIVNALAVGTFVNLGLAWVPVVEGLGVRVAMLGLGTVGFGLGTAMYIGANLGPGPRDGLMTGIARRGYSVRAARTFIEVVALGVGWLLGGVVGVGTVVFSLAVGPLVQFFLPWLVHTHWSAPLSARAARSTARPAARPRGQG
ncbi:MAG: YczE/YyaS/YitT family protein [Actinomycetota bacterium]